MPKNDKFKTDIEDPKYLLALGTFIAWFAFVETVLNQAVWHFSKLDSDPQIAKAIFGPLRVDDALNRLTRLIEARKLRGPEIKELKLLIEQLRELLRARNEIVHRGATGYHGQSFIVTNKPFVHIPSRTTTRRIGPIILGRMINDLSEISIRLSIIARDIVPGYTRRALRKELPILRQAAWLYKPPAPKRRRRKERQKPPKPKPQH